MNTLSPRNRASETPSPNSRPCARPLSRACGLRVAAWLALSGALFIAAPANAQFAFSGTVDTQHQVISNGPPVAVTLPEATGGTGAVAYTCTAFRHVSYTASQFNGCPVARGITFDPATRELIIDTIRRRTTFSGQSDGVRDGNYNVTFTATDSAATPQTTILAFTVTIYRQLDVQNTTVNASANSDRFTTVGGSSATNGMPMPYFPGAPGFGSRFQDQYRYHLDLSGVDRSVEVQTFKLAAVPDHLVGYWTEDDRNLYTFVLNSPVADLTFIAANRQLQGRFHQAYSGNLPYFAYDAAGSVNQKAFVVNALAVAPTLAAIPAIEFAASDVRPQTLPAASGTVPVTYTVSIPPAAASWLKADTAPVDSPRALSITVGTAAEGDSTVITYSATNSSGTATRMAAISVTGALAWMDAGNYPTDLTFNRLIDANDGYSIQGIYTLPEASGGDGGPYAYDFRRGTSNNPAHWFLNLNTPNQPTRVQLGSMARAGDSINFTYSATDTTGTIAETFSVYVIDSLRLAQPRLFFELGDATQQETLNAATGGAGAYTYGLTGQDDVAWLEADVSSAANTPPVLSIIHTGANAAVNGDTHELTYTVSNTVGSVTTIFSVEVNALLGITAENLTFVAGDFTAQALPAATGGDGVYVYALTGDTSLNWLSIAHSDTSTVPMISINNFAVGGNTANFNYSATDSSGTESAAFSITVVAPVSLGDGSDVFLTFTVGDTTAQALPSATGGGGGYAYTLVNLTPENWLTATGGGASPYMLAINANAAKTNAVVLTYSAVAAVDDMTILVNVKVIDELALVAEDLKFSLSETSSQTLPMATGGNEGPYTYALTSDALGDWLLVDAGDGTTPPVLSLQHSGANAATETDSDMLTYTVTDATGTASATFGVVALDDLVFEGGDDAAMVLTFTDGQSTEARTLPEGKGGTGPYTYSLIIPTSATWLGVVERSSASSQRRASASLNVLSSHATTFTLTEPPVLTISSGATTADNAELTYTITDSSSPPFVVTALIRAGVAAMPTFSVNAEPVFVFTAGQPSKLTFEKVTGGASPIVYELTVSDEENLMSGTPSVTWLANPIMAYADGTPYVSGTPPIADKTVAIQGRDDAYRFPITATDDNDATAYLGGANGEAYLIVRRAPTLPDLPAFSATPLLLDTNPMVALTFTGAPTDSTPTDTGSQEYAFANKDLLATPLVHELILSVDGAVAATFSSTSAFDSSASTQDAAHSQTLSAVQLVHAASPLTFNSLGFVTFTETVDGTAYTYGYSPQFEVIGELTFAGRYSFEFKVTDKNGATASKSGAFVVSAGAGWDQVAEVDNGNFTFEINVPVADGGKMTMSVGTFFPAALDENGAASDELTYAIDPSTIPDWVTYTAGTATNIIFAPYTDLFISDTDHNESLTFMFSVQVTDAAGIQGGFLTMVVVVNEDSSNVGPPTVAGLQDSYSVTVRNPLPLAAAPGITTHTPAPITVVFTDINLAAQSPSQFPLLYSALTWVDATGGLALPAGVETDYISITTSDTTVPVTFTLISNKIAAFNGAENAVVPFKFALTVTDRYGGDDRFTFTLTVTEEEVAFPEPTFAGVQTDYTFTPVGSALTETIAFTARFEGYESNVPHIPELSYFAYGALSRVGVADADLPTWVSYTAGNHDIDEGASIYLNLDADDIAELAAATSDGTPFRFSVTATDHFGQTATLEFTISLTEGSITPPQGHYFEINKIVMAQVGEAIVSDTINVITDRLGSVRLQQSDAEPYFGIGGESSPSKIIAKNAKGLVDGTKTPKQLLNGARLVLPLIGEYGAPLPSGMAFWISANHRDMSADTDIVNWEGDMRNIYIGVDSTVNPRAVMGMAFNRANIELDYEDLRPAPESGEDNEYAGIGKYEIDLTGINPYISWRHGKVDLWVTLGQSVGDLTITRLDDPDHNTQPGNPDDQGVKTNLRLKTAAAGGSGLWATDGDSQLRVRGEVFTSRMEIDAAESNAGKEIDQNIAGTVAQTIDGGLVRLGLELVNPDILPGGARMEPMYEFGARYDYGESEVGGGIEAATGLRFSGAKNQVSGIFRLHGVTSSDGAYDEWGAYALLRNRAGGDGQGLSLDLRPSYGADDSIDLWQAALETATQTALDPSQYAMQIAARIGYGITGGRGLLTPFTEWTHRDYDTYRLGVDWSPHDDFTLNLIGETEQLPSGDQQSVLLQGTINF